MEISDESKRVNIGALGVEQFPTVTGIFVFVAFWTATCSYIAGHVMDECMGLPKEKQGEVSLRTQVNWTGAMPVPLCSGVTVVV